VTGDEKNSKKPGLLDRQGIENKEKRIKEVTASKSLFL